MYRLEMGTRFLHARITDRYNDFVTCVVTQVAQDVIYWKRNDSKRKAAEGSFKLAEASKYVLRVLPNSLGV